MAPVQHYLTLVFLLAFCSSTCMATIQDSCHGELQTAFLHAFQSAAMFNELWLQTQTSIKLVISCTHTLLCYASKTILVWQMVHRLYQHIKWHAKSRVHGVIFWEIVRWLHQWFPQTTEIRGQANQYLPLTSEILGETLYMTADTPQMLISRG